MGRNFGGCRGSCRVCRGRVLGPGGGGGSCRRVVLAVRVDPHAKSQGKPVRRLVGGRGGGGGSCSLAVEAALLKVGVHHVDT